MDVQVEFWVDLHIFFIGINNSDEVLAVSEFISFFFLSENVFPDWI